MSMSKWVIETVGIGDTRQLRGWSELNDFKLTFRIRACVRVHENEKWLVDCRLMVT